MKREGGWERGTHSFKSERFQQGAGGSYASKVRKGGAERDLEVERQGSDMPAYGIGADDSTDLLKKVQKEHIKGKEHARGHSCQGLYQRNTISIKQVVQKRGRGGIKFVKEKHRTKTGGKEDKEGRVPFKNMKDVSFKRGGEVDQIPRSLQIQEM